EVDAEPVRPAADGDPLLQPVEREKPADPPLGRHPDDAVALGRGVPDDLRDRVARDRDAPEARRNGMTRLHARIRPDGKACGCSPVPSALARLEEWPLRQTSRSAAVIAREPPT